MSATAPAVNSVALVGKFQDDYMGARPEYQQLMARTRRFLPWPPLSAGDRGGRVSDHGRPYDLRHSFASLLLHEGCSVIYIARQLGHDARLTPSTYGHVMDEFEDTPRLDAQTAIAEARAALRDSAASTC